MGGTQSHAPRSSARGGALPRAVFVLVAGCWALALAVFLTGLGPRISHDHLIKHGPPLPLAGLIFVLGWTVMVGAMMLPPALSATRVVNDPPSRAAAARFLGVFTLVWVAFGAVLFVADIGIHTTVDHTPWLSAHPWLIGAGTLAVAGLAQLTPLKSRLLVLCREPGRHRRADEGPGLFGARHGLACLGSDGPLMLAMFGAGIAQVTWMVALTAVMLYEVRGTHFRYLQYSLAALLLVWAALMAAHPAWLPAVLASLT